MDLIKIICGTAMLLVLISFGCALIFGVEFGQWLLDIATYIGCWGVTLFLITLIPFVIFGAIWNSSR